MPNDEAAIRRWSGSGAAVRMRGSELLVIDLDVHVAAVRDLMLEWLTEHHPEFMAKCLRRHSGAITIALIGRGGDGEGYAEDRALRRRRDRSERRFRRGLHRQQQALRRRGGRAQRAGANTTTAAGTSPRRQSMRCPGWRTADIAPMLAAFEEIMAVCGWEKVIPAIGKDAIGTKVYDLVPGKIFTLSDGEQITLEDLERLARAASASAITARAG